MGSSVNRCSAIHGMPKHQLTILCTDYYFHKSVALSHDVTNTFCVLTLTSEDQTLQGHFKKLLNNTLI